MGNKATKGVALKPKDVAKYAGTGFNPEEIQTLYAQFMSWKTPGSSDAPVITDAEFQAGLGFTDRSTSLFLDRIFKLIDENKDGIIGFDEFINTLAVFSPTASEKKLRFTFNVYDMEGKGRITPADLKALLSAALREGEVAMTDVQLDRMVADTFRVHDVNGDGVMDYEEYKHMCIASPGILKPLTLNVSELLQEAK